jgi:hypothetical protein
MAAWLAIYFKLTSSLDSRALYETTILAFFLAFPIFLIWQILRAPYVLDAQRGNSIDTLKRELETARNALTPRLVVDFDPNGLNFIQATRLAGSDHTNVVFIHVLARCLSASVSNCRGFITSIAGWSNDQWVETFNSRVSLFWEGHEEGPIALTLYKDSPHYLDIAFVYETENFIRLVHPLAKLLDSMPKSFGPGDKIKIEVLVVGDDNTSASITLSLQSGSVWSMPRITRLDRRQL